MTYNNGFPVTYPQMYYPQNYQMYPQTGSQMYPQQAYQSQLSAPASAPAPQTTDIKWVSGEAGAKAYLVAPNSTVQLWDSEAYVIYLKSADASGMPSMKILDYTIRETPTSSSVQNSNSAPKEEYATKSELDTLKAQVKSLRREFERKGAENE